VEEERREKREEREHTMKAITEGKIVAKSTHPILNAKDSIPLIGVLSPIKP